MRARCFTFTYWSCFNFFLGLSRYTMRPVHTDVYFCVILHNECLLNKEEKLWMMKRLNNIYISLFTLMRYPLYHMYIQWYENKKYEKIKLYCCLDEIGMYSIKAPDQTPTPFLPKNTVLRVVLYGAQWPPNNYFCLWMARNYYAGHPGFHRFRVLGSFLEHSLGTESPIPSLTL